MSAILSTQNLVKKYGYKIVSNNISLTINKGDIYGFVGKKRRRQNYIYAPGVRACFSRQWRNYPLWR